jgi:hypothetical protein
MKHFITARVIKINVFMVLGLLLISWARPNSPTKVALSSSYDHKLDYIIVKINDVTHVVRASQEVSLIRGDTLLVKSASLNNKSSKVGVVNLVGYRHPVHGGSEDRGYKIDSAKNLDKKYSENGADKIYAVTAISSREFHGSIYIKVIEPALKYAVIGINGEDHVLRDGESLDINRSDMVKVKKVETNVDDNVTVNFQIFEQQTKDGSFHEIRFTRSGQMFARIPLKIKG